MSEEKRMVTEIGRQTYAFLEEQMTEKDFYKHLIEELPIGYVLLEFIYNEDDIKYNYKFKEVNCVFEKETGLREEEVVGKKLLDVFWHLDQSELEKLDYNFQRVMEQGKQEFEFHFRTTGKWYRVSMFSPFRNYFAMYFMGITNEKKQLAELENSRKRMENILEGTNAGTWEVNKQTGERFYNRRWAEMLGYKLEELYPIDKETWEKLVYPDDLAAQLSRDKKLYNKEIEFYDEEYRMLHKDGSTVWIQDRGKVISWTEEGDPHIISGTHTDVTKRKNLELELSHERNLFMTTLISVGDGVISTDKKGLVVFINKAAEQLTGWTNEDARGKSFEEVFNTINRQTCEKSRNIFKKVINSGEKHEMSGNTVLIARNGTETAIEDTIAPIIQDDGKITGVVIVFKDCSERKKKQEEILYLSYCDPLTGLYNRRFFENKLKELDTEKNLPITLIMADVNGLKLVNDSFGHGKGDGLLRSAADILSRGCRKTDIVARFGGDEFAAILIKTGREQAEQVIKRIKALSLKEKDCAIDISISFGYETKSSMPEDMRDIFKAAEDNMYSNKLYESSRIKNKIIGRLMHNLYQRGSGEMQHSKRVSRICEKLAVYMNFDKNKVRQIKIAGLMHDIGKTGIDGDIVNKSEHLSDDECREVRKHAEVGYRILSSSNKFSEIAEYVLMHHERPDGSGYPGGLKGDAISVQSKIIAVADAYDSMTVDRPFRKLLSAEEAVYELQRCSGTQFDAEIVNALADIILVKKVDL